MTAPAPRQVVVAFDFSGVGHDVIERAITLACRAPEHVLHFVVVIDRHAGLPTIPPTEGVDYRYAARVQDSVAALLHEACTAHHAPAQVHFFVHARIGKPVEEILQLAREVGAEMILVGCHGHTGVERFLLGSTAERVVREAECPVIVVRKKGYPHVDLVDIVDVKRGPSHHAAPHRYTYHERRLDLRPLEWPL